MDHGKTSIARSPHFELLTTAIEKGAGNGNINKVQDLLSPC